MWAGWEPDRYYARMGASSTAYFGNGDWIEPWRNRIESDEVLRHLADQGMTALITQFYKGMGPEVERPTWSGIANFVKRANHYNLDVWGYVQGHSLFGEFIFPTRPEAREWVARDYDGRPHQWGAAYHRFAPCLGNLDHRAFMKEILFEGIQKLGLSGIQLDNNYYKHCYCPRCRKDFRAWLDQRGDLEIRTGIPTAEAVEPPPLVVNRAVIFDPLVRLWIEFGVARRLEYLSELRSHIESLSPAAVFSGNPAYLKSYASRTTHAVDPSLESRSGDIITIENGNSPRYENGLLYTQADKLLFVAAGGGHAFITSWRPGAFGHSPPIGRHGIWSLLAEEYSFANCLPGNNWFLRSAGDGGTLLQDVLNEERDAFSEARRYFERLEQEVNLPERRLFAEVCLYFDPAIVALNAGNQALPLQTLLGFALSERVIVGIGFPQNEPPPETKVIVLCNQSWIGDDELSKLKRLTLERGIKIWILGDAAKYDDWGRGRSEGSRKAFFNHAGVRHLGGRPEKWADLKGDSEQYFQGAPVRWKLEAEAELKDLANKLKAEQSVVISAPQGVLANLEIHSSRRLLVHLRDLSSERQEVDGVEVKIDPAQWGAVRGYSANWHQPSLSPGEYGQMVLPPFFRYCLLVIEPLRRDLGM